MRNIYKASIKNRNLEQFTASAAAAETSQERVAQADDGIEMVCDVLTGMIEIGN